MVPQLVRIGEEFGIACFSGGGFDGLAGKHDAAVRAVEGGRKTLVLHLGDYDPSGEHLFNSLAEDVIAFAEATGAEVEFERLAVTPEQIATYNLPTAPPKATDRRSFSGTATTQAEALPPDILAAIVREAIEAHRDPEVHRQALAREEAKRRAIRERLTRRPGCAGAGSWRSTSTENEQNQRPPWWVTVAERIRPVPRSICRASVRVDSWVRTRGDAGQLHMPPVGRGKAERAGGEPARHRPAFALEPREPDLPPPASAVLPGPTNTPPSSSPPTTARRCSSSGSRISADCRPTMTTTASTRRRGCRRTLPPSAGPSPPSPAPGPS
jgi:hypothetical protein